MTNSEAPLARGLTIDGGIRVDRADEFVIEDCTFYAAFRERRRLPRWLHKRLLRLVGEPLPAISIEGFDRSNPPKTTVTPAEGGG